MSSFNSKLTNLILAEVEDAFLKVAATPDVPDFPTREEARDSFLALLRAELIERLGMKKTRQEEATATVTIPEAEHAQESESVEKKKRGPMTEEAKAAMKAKRDATLAAKKGAAPADVAAPAAPAAEAASTDSPKEKKKRGPMTEEAKAAMKAKRDATIAAKKDVDVLADGVAALSVEEKPKAAKKVKVSEDVNVPKIDATWRKYIKTAAKEAKVEVTKETEDEILSYLNGLTKEELAAKKGVEHISAFLGRSNAAAAPGDALAVEMVEAGLTETEFEGKTYYVKAETKRVFVGEGEQDEEGGWTHYQGIGYMGMDPFAEMKLE